MSVLACAPLPQQERPPAMAIPPEYQQEVRELTEIIDRYHHHIPPELSPRHAAVHQRLGIIYYNIGELSEADYHLHQSVQMNPGVAEAHLYLGRVLEAEGRYREAIQELTIALELDPGLLDARLELGELRQLVEESSSAPQ
ncbi:MAG: tetratricopeptide repeat protein [Nitrospirota bacterium]